MSSASDQHPGQLGQPPRRSVCQAAFTLKDCEQTGQRLGGGRYEICGLLGHGGTSDVYLADDYGRGHLVIIKRLRGEVAGSSEIRSRFLTEARTTMSIEHPNVVRVLGVEQSEDGRPYLIMEALLGEPLGEFLRRQGSVRQGLAVVLARQAADGLSAAHRAGIVHRDVKPDNLFLLGPTGDPHGLKVIDFGFAKQLKGPISTANLVVGTAQYMAPEQVLCDPIDARTDVYALGVVMFRMLTGQLPFDAEPGADLLSHQLFSPAPPPSWLTEDLDRRLESVVLRAMRKHPENRYQSMSELGAELGAVVGLCHESGVRLSSMARVPDVYKPRNPSGRQVAELLASRFGADPPPPPSSLLPPSDED